MLAWRRPTLLVACLIVGLGGGWRAQVSWNQAVPRHTGPYAGWVTVVGDPAPFGSGLRVTVEIDGERFDAWAYGSSRRRLIDRQAGEIVYVVGQRRVEHLQRAPGSASSRCRPFRDCRSSAIGTRAHRLYRTSSRVRTALRRTAESAMGAADAGLFTGLVIGDDARQSAEMVTAFRRQDCRI